MKRPLLIFALLVALPVSAISSLESTIVGAERRWEKFAAKGISTASDLDLAQAIGKAEASFITLERHWLQIHTPISKYGDAHPCVGLLALAGNSAMPYEIPSVYPELVASYALEPYLERLKSLRASIADARELLASRFRTEPNRLRELLLRFHHGELDVINTETVDALVGIERALIEFSLIQPQNFDGHTIYPWNAVTDLAQSFYNKAQKFYTVAQPTASDVVWDLGCGHGRILLYGAILFPETTFKGVDVVGPRLDGLRRAAHALNLQNLHIFEGSVLDVDFSDGTLFYMFNPFPKIMPQVMERIHTVSRHHPVGVYGYAVLEMRQIASEPDGWLEFHPETREFTRSRPGTSNHSE